MSFALRHSDWHLIAEQRFRQRAGIAETSQRFRGESFLVLCDKITGKHLRLSQRAAGLWRQFDGRKSTQQIWEELTRKSGPSQSEIMEWVMTLVTSGLLLSDQTLDPRAFSERSRRMRDKMLEAKLAGPLSIKVKLFDPSPLIRMVYPVFAPLLTPWGGIAIVVLIAAALVTAAVNWETLTQSVDRNILSQTGLIGLALAYPILKALHELGHGLMVHKFGGQVREFGVMFLIFFPVPYVEASDSNGFSDKHHRMLVAGAGVIAEVTIAALSLFAWLLMEPSLERAILFNFMVIGSVSTLLFNGNPLLKFDSYFVLADWLEIPNLATKAGEYVQDVFLSRLLGLRPMVYPQRGEAGILLGYGVVSLVYRWVLAVTIILIVSQLLFVLGIVLAIWSFVMTFLVPLRKMVKTAMKMVRAQSRARTSFWRLLVASLVVYGLVAVLKLPFSALGEGQVTVQSNAELWLETSGEVAQVFAQSGAYVRKGDALVQLINPTQTARAEALRIAVADLQNRLRSGGLSVIERQSIMRELTLTQADLEKVTQAERARTLYAPKDGRLEWRGGRPPLQGAFVFRGDGLGQIIGAQGQEIVMAFPAAYAGLLPLAQEVPQLRLADGTTMQAFVDRARVIDQGQQAPSAVLLSAGGRVAEMPGAAGLALDPALVVWLRPAQDLASKVGMRGEVRIHLPRATLLSQVGFYLRRLFLRANRI